VSYSIVVIGTSWGGLEALSTIVSGLPADFPLPIVAVQHRSRDARALLPGLLAERTQLSISEAEDKDPLSGGRLFIAPADYHLLIDEGHLVLDTDEHVRYSRPSIDVTFASAADSYGKRVIGVVLTGANNDGAEGLSRIAGRGGYAIIEDPSGATSPTMPSAALRAVPRATVLPLADIASHLRLLAAVSDLSEISNQENS
jgi:two-component system chemotaxis response regulator CheB